MGTYAVELEDGTSLVVDAQSPEEAEVIALWKQGAADKDEKPGSFLDPLSQGMTMGFGDELVAGAVSPFVAARHDQNIGDTYTRIRDLLRRQNISFGERNPAASAALTIGGAIPSAMAIGAPALGPAPSLSRVLGVGAGEGALSGLGASDAPILESGAPVAKGAAMGLAGGAAGELMQRGLGKIWPEKTRAQQLIGEALEADGLTPASVRSASRQMGPDATLTDIGGPGTVGLGMAVQGTSPATRAMARKGLTARNAGQTERLLTAVESATGVKPDYSLITDGIESAAARRSEVAGPLWDAAKQVQIPITDKLKNALDQDVVKKAYSLAQKEARFEGRDLPDLEDLAGKPLDFDIWASIKSHVYDVINTGDYVDPITGRATKLGVSANKFYDGFVDELKRLNVEYEPALNAWAGESEVIGALDKGRKFLTDTTSAVKGMAKKMARSEKEAYLTGAAEAIREKMGRAGEGQIREFNFMENDNFKNKLKAFLPEGRKGDAALAGFLRDMRTARKFKETEGLVRQGSQTQPRQAAVAALENQRPWMSTVADSGSITGGAMAATMGKLKKALGTVPQGVREEVARRLFAPGGAESALEFLKSIGVGAAKLKQLQLALRTIPVGIGAGSMPVMERD